MSENLNLVTRLDDIINYTEKLEPVQGPQAQKVQTGGDIAFRPNVPPGHTTYSWQGGASPAVATKKVAKAVPAASKPKPEVAAEPAKKKPAAPKKKNLTKSEKRAKAKDHAPVIKSYERRDWFVNNERAVQKMWESKKVFESDPKPGQEKFMCTFPFPYTNGYFHVGHAFTLSKAEFAAGYNRLKGKNVLFPFGFHCTGMPIAGAAVKLQEEMKEFGCPPKFPVVEEEVQPKHQGKKKGKKKKGKAASKKSKAKYQWEILRDFNLTDEEIQKFTEPSQWLHHFPPIGMEHLKRFGLKADFRRSFVTTEENPFYDAFIRWQFMKLKEMDKIMFGNRPSIFSPKKKQVCGDHDRSSGEGVGTQNYTLIKMQVLEGETPYTKEKGDSLAEFFKTGKKIFMVAGTLRPETMYGQTNCFVLPGGQYSVVETKDGELWITGESAALNMSWQKMLATPQGEVNILGKMWGKDLLGRKVKAPYAQYEYVHVLPLKTIKMDKATGVVTSVPSDAPDDYAALMDMKKNKKEREQFYITEEMVEHFEVVEIINIPATEAYPQLGRQSAVSLCKARKVKSQNDEKKLKDIKDICYKNGFAHGTMLLGKYEGKPVRDAKDMVKADMIAEGLAAEYWEPEEVVVARTGERCVVAFTDQWFLRYGEESWRNQIQNHLDNMEFYNIRTRQGFDYTVGWLKEWACSREFGLGTKVPFDEKFVIESLSDSTIYMSYYTICHHIQGNCNLLGNNAPIKAESLTSEVFDYIFLGKPMPKSDISSDVLKKMRDEFLYWYPMDLRVSGKDLIGNHLTMALYNHAAIWHDQPDKWPRGYFCNGHTMINSEKMSKSTGNFMTIIDGCEELSADALRFALADAGDGLEDANFEKAIANAAINNLWKEKEWMLQMMEQEDFLRKGDYNDLDKIFDNAISVCIQEADEAYSKMQYKVALRCSWYNLQNARDFWRNNNVSWHVDLVKRFMRTQLILLSPICPHFCETMWNKLGNEGLCVNASWPKVENYDPVMQMKFMFIQEMRSAFHKEWNRQHKNWNKQAAKKPNLPPLDCARIYVSTEYLDFQKDCLNILSKFYEKESNSVDEGYRQEMKKNKNKQMMKKMFDFSVMIVKNDVPERGESALSPEAPFDELATIQNDMNLVIGDVPVKPTNVTAFAVNDPNMIDEKGYSKKSIPRKPTVYFFSGQ